MTQIFSKPSSVLFGLFFLFSLFHMPLSFAQNPSQDLSGETLSPATDEQMTSGEIASEKTSSLNESETPKLEQIILSRSGLGYFEYSAKTDTQGRLTLSVPQEQLDDVLKTLLIFDVNETIQNLSFTSHHSLESSFKKLNLNPSVFDSLEGLLQEFKGAQISVVYKGEIVKGRLAQIEKDSCLPACIQKDSPLPSFTLTLIDQNRLHSFPFSAIESLQFEAPLLQARLEEALKLMSETKQQGDAQITLQLDTSLSTSLRFGYLIETPLWKTSYRFHLREDSAALQGWALIHNLSGKDWSGVRLSLVSGSPLSYHQQLSQAEFAVRPEFEQPSMARRPRALKSFARSAQSKELLEDSAELEKGGFASSEAPFADTPASEEGLSYLAYSFPEPLSLKKGESAFIPLLDRPLTVEHLSLWENNQAKTSLKITNTTDTLLPAGLMTTYEQSEKGVRYLGDISLKDLPAGETVRATLATDPKVFLKEENPLFTTNKRLLAQNGLLYRIEEQSTTQVFTGRTAKGITRTILIPVFPIVPKDNRTVTGAELIEDEGNSFLRFVLTDQETEVSFRQNQTISTQLEIGTGSLQDLFLSLENTELTERQDLSVNDLKKAQDLYQSTVREQNELEKEKEHLFETQAQIRENITSLSNLSQSQAKALTKDYLDDLSQTQKNLKEIEKKTDLLNDKQKKAREEIEKHLKQLIDLFEPSK